MSERTVTALLRHWRAGDRAAEDLLIRRVYSELHALAERQLRGERPGHTLRPTELVSEAYLRLSLGVHPEWVDRAHFFAIAARTMRQILVDHARKRHAHKRDAGAPPETFDETQVVIDHPEELLALDAALAALAKEDERKARVVELAYFGGLTYDEIAAVLDVHANTVARDLKFAEAWLHRAIVSGD